MSDERRAGLPIEEEWDDYEQDDNWPCTHCNGEGVCTDGADPLGNCPDEPHRCHACRGSGAREDQTIF
jgi:DnaJ-class molecular chaperone